MLFQDWRLPPRKEVLRCNYYAIFFFKLSYSLLGTLMHIRKIDSMVTCLGVSTINPKFVVRILESNLWDFELFVIIYTIERSLWIVVGHTFGCYFRVGVWVFRRIISNVSVHYPSCFCQLHQNLRTFRLSIIFT
jgi:hypothetical protein